MKVAYFIGSLNRGGAEMLTLDICRKRESAPFDMVLIYRNEGELSEVFKETGVPMLRIKPGKNKLGYFYQIRKALKQEIVDLIHAQTLTNALISVICTFFSSIKVVATFHGFYKSAMSKVKRHLVMWSADALLFVSKYERDWYVRSSFLCPKNHCHVVYNGLVFDKLDVKHTCPDFLVSSHQNKPECVCLVMVGNFAKGRSQFFVCKSLKRLVEQGNRGFQFFFVGKRVDATPWRYDECVRYCEDHYLTDCVHFVGSRGDVPAILQHSDGFVYASEHDSFGIAVVEAVASGLPTLVNDWDVMQEVVGEKGWAEMYRTDDVEDCCSKMRSLIENIDYRKRLAKQAKREIRHTYSIETHIDNLYSVYSSLYKKN